MLKKKGAWISIPHHLTLRQFVYIILDVSKIRVNCIVDSPSAQLKFSSTRRRSANVKKGDWIYTVVLLDLGHGLFTLYSMCPIFVLTAHGSTVPQALVT
jgi:hypothetical protein